MAAPENNLPPCESQGLSGNQASQNQVLSTDAERTGDIMFILGGFAEDRRPASYCYGRATTSYDASGGVAANAPRKRASRKHVRGRASARSTLFRGLGGHAAAIVI